MTDTLEINIGETQETDLGKLIDRYVSLWKAPGKGLTDWLAAEYIERKGQAFIESIALSDSVEKATIALTERVKVILDEIMIFREAIYKALEAGDESVIVSHDDRFRYPNFRVVYIEADNEKKGESSAGNRSILDRLFHKQSEQRDVKVVENSSRTIYFYIPEPTGCDEVAFYVGRKSDKPIVKIGCSRQQSFKPGEMDRTVVTYNYNGVNRYTGMDAQGATTFPQKAAYFGMRVKLGQMPR